MDDGFELTPRHRIGEDDGAQRRAVDGTVGSNHVRAESRGDGRGRFSSGGGDSVREIVSDQARDAVLAELFENVALAGCGSARQSDLQHLIKDSRRYVEVT